MQDQVFAQQLKEQISKYIPSKDKTDTSLREKFYDRDEFILIEKAFDPEWIKEQWVPMVEHCKKYVHRNYIPFQKKGGSVSCMALSQQAPNVVDFYKSQQLTDMVENIVNEKILLCPDSDPHACALYYYTEEGDHIGWHYDSSFYNGKRYTALLGLVDQSSCDLVCELYTKCKGKKTETHKVRLKPGDFVLFNGDRLWHMVTPLGANEERVVMTMEFVTNTDMTRINRAINNIKDAVTYFGWGSLFGKYEGFQDATANKEPEVEQPKNEGKKELETEIMKKPNSALTPPTVLAFVNPISGGQRGMEVYDELTKIMGKQHVFNVKAENPEIGLAKFKDDPSLRLLVCGGDGTIRWILQACINVGLKTMPPMGIIPLGTGNDLARMFGWGKGYSGESLTAYVQGAVNSVPKPMDLWNCEMTPVDPETGAATGPTTSHLMMNYFNIGYDSQVAHGFHTLRVSNPSLFKSRVINKCWYLYYAFQNFWSGSHDLDSSASLKIDGQEVAIPQGTKTLVILNFVCYQAGVDIWGQKEEENDQKIDDGQIEVIGIGGIFHEAMVRMYLKSGTRIGRGKEITVDIKKKLSVAMAFDGEPEVQQPCKIVIKHLCQTPILDNQTPIDQ